MTARRSKQMVQPTGNRRLTRTERRASEREQNRQQRGKQGRGRRAIPTTQIIGGLATIFIVVGIIVYALIRANTVNHPVHHAGGPPLTNPNDLHPAATMLAAGGPAPNFTLHGVDGGTYGLAAQRGHPVLLEFFAVWCPHCQHEAPIIERLKGRYVPHGVRVWSILANPYGPNYDQSYGQDRTLASRPDLLWFSWTFGEHVPHLVDPSFKVVNEYGINDYPGIFVLDRKGMIVYAQSGEQSYKALATALNKTLAGS